MRYEFPWPPRELSPNARVHWRTLARAKADYKDDCGWLIVATWHDRRRLMPETKAAPVERRLAPPVHARVTFTVADKRRRDSDNFLAMLKPLFDAFVETGVLQDDSHDKLKILEPKWERGPEKKVVVELETTGPSGEPGP